LELEIGAEGGGIAEWGMADKMDGMEREPSIVDVNEGAKSGGKVVGSMG
jgi:hypothetical protein